MLRLAGGISTVKDGLGIRRIVDEPATRHGTGLRRLENRCSSLIDFEHRG